MNHNHSTSLQVFRCSACRQRFRERKNCATEGVEIDFAFSAHHAKEGDPLLRALQIRAALHAANTTTRTFCASHIDLVMSLWRTLLRWAAVVLLLDSTGALIERCDSSEDTVEGQFTRLGLMSRVDNSTRT